MSALEDIEAQTTALPFDGCLIVFVLGGPGSGKGTNCDRLKERYKFAHISVGDLLREEVKKGGDLADEILSYMKEGKMVPMYVTKRLLLQAMGKYGKNVPGFLIDGFPRLKEQAEEFERSIGCCTFVLSYDCHEEVLVQRLLSRGKTSGRVDDNIESIRKRVNVFKNETLPVINYYAATGRVRVVNSEPSIDEVAEASFNIFREYDSSVFQ